MTAPKLAVPDASYYCQTVTDAKLEKQTPLSVFYFCGIMQMHPYSLSLYCKVLGGLLTRAVHSRLHNQHRSTASLVITCIIQANFFSPSGYHFAPVAKQFVWT
jgi:predicted Zn-dependent peptidase